MSEKKCCLMRRITSSLVLIILYYLQASNYIYAQDDSKAAGDLNTFEPISTFRVTTTKELVAMIIGAIIIILIPPLCSVGRDISNRSTDLVEKYLALPLIVYCCVFEVATIFTHASLYFMKIPESQRVTKKHQ